MKLTKEQVLSIKTMRDEGKTIMNIAAQLGVAERTVSYWVKRLKAQGHPMVSIAKRGARPLEI